MTKNKANSMFKEYRKSSEMILKLYRSYVKLNLKFCILFWIPINVKDADMLEGVQRRVTKMIPSLRNLSYEEIIKVGYVLLRRRRLRDDMTEVFKMIRGIDKLNLEKHFCMDEDGRTRGHAFVYKLKRI